MDNIIQYNKAIRDKIPEIIRESGKDCKIISLSNGDFLAALEMKLQEELNEYMESKSLEELADLLEIIHRLAELKDSSLIKLENIRKAKKNERGGFQKNLLLIEIS
jgi:predicted house-cleaning noncanonical NTP pyrophosphatase (MazG superfamily)